MPTIEKTKRPLKSEKVTEVPSRWSDDKVVGFVSVMRFRVWYGAVGRRPSLGSTPFRGGTARGFNLSSGQELRIIYLN